MNFDLAGGKGRRFRGRDVPKRRSEKGQPPAKPADASSREPSDWRAELLHRVRRLIKEADPDVTEEQKWKEPSNPAGVPVWYRDGIICTAETYENHARLTFARGAALKDPAALFNSGIDGKVLRAIVFHEGDKIDDVAFKDLIRSAAALNTSSAGG